MMITIKIISCKLCGGQYYGGEQDVKLKAGNERNAPTEVYFTTLKVSKCATCQTHADRTKAARKKRLHD